MTALEIKILDALKEKVANLEQYDRDRQADYDKYMALAAEQTEKYWQDDYKGRAEWALHFQKHGYDFLDAWKNTISEAMYGKTYHEWHSAQAGRYKGTGHGAYVTTELSNEEIDKVDRVFNALVKQGYIRLSKSGKQAKMVK